LDLSAALGAAKGKQPRDKLFREVRVKMETKLSKLTLKIK
jgi:hypothetical protein